MRQIIKTALLLLTIISASPAHIGSPDIYLDGSAGPYKLFVTIRPPQVIPGVAEVDVRSETAGVHGMKVVPMPLAGPGADHPPVPEALHRTSADSQFFNGSVWLMADGSWQVRILVDGAQGAGTLSVPVPAVARTTRKMEWQLGLVLSTIGIFLVGGLAAICGAAVREATVPAGVDVGERRKRNGRIATAVAFCIIALILWGGKAWWDSEVKVYQGRVYKPLNMRAELDSGSVLNLSLSEPGWMQPGPNSTPRFSRILFVRKMDDLVPDHNHLMHLYAIRQPGLDVIYHLHPDLVQPDLFRLSLPAMPAGDYKLYADVVHENGLPETLTGTVHVNGILEAARPLTGDDARGQTTAVGTATLGDTFTLPDGYRMHWIHSPEPLQAREGQEFRFELLTPDGSKPTDMELYMGMVGHAAFVKTDGTVFAHIHPNGTASMAAMMLAQGSNNMEGMDHGQMHMDMAIPNTVAFPYGLPNAGQYRIFVQMKHGTTVETGVFDTIAH